MGPVDDELVERWSQIEAMLREVLTSHGDKIASDQRGWVEEWLDHNELGLAWDSLVESLVDHAAVVDEADLRKLEHAATLMEIDLRAKPAWSALHLG